MEGFSVPNARRNRTPVKNSLSYYLFVLPALVLFLVFRVFPIFYAFVMSTFDFRLAGSVFIGLQNYVTLWGDALFSKAFFNTFYFLILSLPPLIVIPFFLALVINSENTSVMGFFKIALFLPVITTWVVVGLVWKWILDSDFGILNLLLGALGLNYVHWLSDPAIALPSVSIVNFWKEFGYNMILFLAGLQTFNRSLLEAALVDGASYFARLTRIVIPVMRPILLVVLILTVISIFRMIVPVFVMTGGDPIGSTQVISFFVFQQAFDLFNFGYAAASSVILFFIIIVVTIIQMRYIRSDLTV